MGKTAEDLKHELEQQRESLGRDLVAIGDRVSPGRMVERRRASMRQSLGRARDAVMGAKDAAVGTTTDGFATAATGISDSVFSAGSSVSSAMSTVGDAATGAPEALRAQTQGNPLAAGLIAFGVGALAGTVVPTTRREQQAVAQVQPALESAAQELGQGAQVVAESAKEHAADAVHHLKDQAQEAAAAIRTQAEAAGRSEGGDPGPASTPRP